MIHPITMLIINMTFAIEYSCESPHSLLYYYYYY